MHTLFSRKRTTPASSATPISLTIVSEPKGTGKRFLAWWLDVIKITIAVTLASLVFTGLVDYYFLIL